MKNASSNINNINDNKFGGNIEHKSILDALIKIISDNTKMDDASKKELNQKFNELKEFMNKLMKNEN